MTRLLLATLATALAATSCSTPNPYYDPKKPHHTERGFRNTDPTAVDVFRPHPLYGDAGWVCVIDPAEATAGTVLALLREAHEAARARTERRAR